MGRKQSATSPPRSTFSMKFSNNLSVGTIRQLARKYDGKLLSRDEIDLNDHEFTSLLAASFFHPIEAIKVSLFQAVCRRCNNQDWLLFANIPCTRCKRTHLYCRNCIQMGRMMECDFLYYWTGPSYKWEGYERALTWDGELTLAQEKAAEKIVETVKTKNELLVWAVTGAGKTEMLFPGIDTALRLGNRICIATPRTDVVRELSPRLKRAFQSVHIEALYSGSKDKDGTAQLIISTTHQLLRFRQAFDVLIIDEIDAFPYHHDETLQFAAKRAAKKEAALVYLTATPRPEQKRLLNRKKLPHVFVPLRFHGYPLPVPKTVYCSSIKKHLSESNIPKQFLHWLKNREKESRQLLIFVPTIELGEKLQPIVAKICVDMNIVSKRKQVASVHAEDKQRENKINMFRKQQIKVLITTTILERGVTFPEIDVVVLDAGHEVFDEAALVQIAGRAGRSNTDPTGEVVYFHDGKTNAIVAAIASIKEMNRRGEKLRLEGVI